MANKGIIGELDEAIRVANRAFHGKLKAPFGDDDKARVERCLGRPIPEAALDWFEWCGGSGDGLQPSTAWGAIEADELISEHPLTMELAESLSFSPEVVLPLLTNRAGDLWYYVEGPGLDGPSMVLSERGEVAGDAVPLEGWLGDLKDAWMAEANTVRVPWLRTMRTPMGWMDLQIPKPAAKKLSERLETGGPVQLRDRVAVEASPPQLLIQVGASPAWETNDGHTVVTLSKEGLEHLAKALKAREASVFIEELGDLKISLEDR